MATKKKWEQAVFQVSECETSSSAWPQKLGSQKTKVSTPSISQKATQPFLTAFLCWCAPCLFFCLQTCFLGLLAYLYRVHRAKNAPPAPYGVAWYLIFQFQRLASCSRSFSVFWPRENLTGTAQLVGLWIDSP